MPDRIAHHNRLAWNRQSAAGSRWAEPVTSEQVAAARRGEFEVILTPTRPVPPQWLGPLAGARVLCLASGGGQQAPLLAAAGARVTSYDLSDIQLAKDALVAGRDGLALSCLQGDMSALPFDDACFDLVFNPVSVCFVPEVRVVWRECARVLRPGGRLLSGFLNPAFYLFDADEADQNGRLVVANRLPYREDAPDHLPTGRRAEVAGGDAMEFSHTLADLLGGQTAAGLAIVDLYEDGWGEGSEQPLDAFMASFLATLAVKGS
ncbi:MAG: class I SAM-dependent methyltransferase [Candidatus Krumholzibacteriia bacterium]